VFSNISEYKRNELVKLWMDTMVSSKSFSDSYYSKLVYEWFHSIEKKDVVGYPTILDNTQDIVDLIQRYKNKGLFVDIGSSNCQLAKDISNLLHMKPISVTIPHGHKTLQYQEICKDKIHYDKHFIKNIRSLSEKVGVVFFNYSLHHFGKKESIQRILRESYGILEKGGILLIRDHDSSNDLFMDLQHIVLEMKHSNELSFSQYQTHIQEYIHSLQSHYFNVNNMKQWCKEIGFTYVSSKKKTNMKDICNTEIDISNTVYLCFRKQASTRKIKI